MLCVLFLLSGGFFLPACSHQYALQRTLTRLGYAWFGDLQRVRGIYARTQPKTLSLKRQMKLVEADRWRRSVRVTIRAIRRRARIRGLRPQSEIVWLLHFARRLTKVSRDAREPQARIALIQQIVSLGKIARTGLSWLEELLQKDPEPMVRKSAFSGIAALRPHFSVLQRAVTRAFADRNDWVRSSVLLFLISDVFLPNRQTEGHLFSILRSCIMLKNPPEPVFSPRKSLSPQFLLNRLRNNCLLLLSHLPGQESSKALPMLKKLAGRNGPLQASSKRVLRRLQMPKRLLPSRLLLQKMKFFGQMLPSVK